MSISLISHLHTTFCDYNSFTFRDFGSMTKLWESFCTILLFFVKISQFWNTPPSYRVIKNCSIL